MTRLLFRLVIIPITLLAVSIGAVRVGYGLAFPMEEAGIFAMSDCELPCWMGLEARVTDRDDVTRILDEFQRVDGNSYQRRFTVSEQLTGRVETGSRLSLLILFYDDCAVNLVYELGVPDVIIRGDVEMFFYYENGVSLQIYELSGFRGVTVKFWERASMRAYLDSQQQHSVSFHDPMVTGRLLACESGE